MDPAALLERVLDEPKVAHVRAVLDTYGRAAGGLLANGLAFTALFAVIPIALVTLGLTGLLVADPAIQQALASAIVSMFPPVADLVDGALQALTTGAAVASIVGIVGLIWTVSQFYVTLDVAFSRIFADEPERDIVRRTARGLVWVGVLLGLVVAIVIAGALVSAWTALLPEHGPIANDVASIFTSWPMMFVVTTAIVALVYRLVPPRAPSWSAVLLPAVIVAVAIVVLTQAFAFLAPRLVGVAALAGSLATAFIALAWLSFGFQALLYGASWVRVRDDRARAASSALAGPAAPAEPGGGGE